MIFSKLYIFLIYLTVTFGCGGDTHLSKEKGLLEDIRKNTLINQDIGTLSRKNHAPHCTAFAISKKFLATSLDCIKTDYKGDSLETYMQFNHKTDTTPVEIIATFPYTRTAYLRATNSQIFEPFKRAYGKPHSMISIDSRSSNVRSEVKQFQYFIHNNVLYHGFTTFEGDAGAPILDKTGGYIGIHLGIAWHKGKFFNVAKFHDRDVDIMKMVSFKAEVGS